jgi:alpha-galactosidase/6-phospho-beta-glucosidase family protein
VTGTERVIHANVPNHGLIDNLTQGAVVEVPATVDANGTATTSPSLNSRSPRRSWVIPS